MYGPRRVAWAALEDWHRKTLTPQDAVVIEMTTNTWEVYDELLPHVHSVTVVHPPHVRWVTEPQVMNDRIAAFNLAKLLSKGMLKGLWVPPLEVRERRALIAQRNKMTRLATQAKNRLHAVLHRHHLLPAEGDPFLPERRGWWLDLPVSAIEKVRLLCDLDTLAFARQQLNTLNDCLGQIAVNDPQMILLLQLPGFGIVNAITVLAAIGDIARFPDAKYLVGYAGLGGRLHDFRPDHPHRQDHESGPTRPAYHPGRSRPGGRQHTSLLESGTGAPGTPLEPQQSHRSYRPQTAGGRVARTHQTGRRQTR